MVKVQTVNINEWLTEVENKLMSKKKLPKLYRRTWLNKGEGTAYIVIDAEVETIDYGKRKGGTEVSATLDLKDCNRQICLEFWYNGQKEYKERLAKIALLKKQVDDLQNFMLANPPTEPPKEEKKVEEVGAKKNKEVVGPTSKASEELPLTELRVPEFLANSGILEEKNVIDIGTVRLSPVRKAPNETTGS
jgi:hypothetical protein